MGWRKSSFCAASECVQIAADGGGILVCDSLGTVLRFSPENWARFTRSLKR